MPVPLSEYTQVKDKYCLVYRGPNAQFVEQLKKARPLFEAAFPRLQMYLCCLDQHMSILSGEDRVVTLDQLKDNLKVFGHVREVTWNVQTNPVDDLLAESGLNWKKSEEEK